VAEPGALRIGMVLLGVRDTARSLDFYRDALRLPVQFSSGEFSFLTAGDVNLVLRHAPDLAGPEDARLGEIVFQVEDIDAAYRTLRARGVVFRVEPRPVTGDQLAADFRDPDGHALSIFGPRPAEG
jgi:catechol 2,3-dioxygenase-like lactoylglutathione lyase family enzyme